VEEAASRQPHFGERLPCLWLHCDQSLDQLIMSGLNFCSLAQVTVEMYSVFDQPLYKLPTYELSTSFGWEGKGRYGSFR